MVIRILLIPGLLGLSHIAVAETPVTGKLQTTRLASGKTVSWIATRNQEMEWHLSVTKENRVLIDADLGSCSFCDGEEDNCASNGVFIREVRGIDTPVAIAVCHVGAHSQQFQLFDPAVSASTAAVNISGSYFVDWKITGNDVLDIEWDGERNKVPGCKVKTDNSLEMAPPQNRLLIDSSCYRTGKASD